MYGGIIVDRRKFRLRRGWRRFDGGSYLGGDGGDRMLREDLLKDDVDRYMNG